MVSKKVQRALLLFFCINKCPARFSRANDVTERDEGVSRKVDSLLRKQLNGWCVLKRKFCSKSLSRSYILDLKVKRNSFVITFCLICFFMYSWLGKGFNSPVYGRAPELSSVILWRLCYRESHQYFIITSENRPVMEIFLSIAK